ncbi:hypothetical protein [Streptomyces sp. NRRL S-340]|uniref:hypothetical protein n=1 Tax=Streptomyces sp. NRRL S-340 TaxID=1463901 RepID=UPI0018FE80CE|nr:hypothetical protein [Streptomyces sp. NRRL S-340]
MPENTVTAPLAPMEPDDVASSFAYVRTMQAHDIDTAGAVANETGPEMRRLLLDVAARVFIPVIAMDDCDGKPCARTFLAAAARRLLLEVPCRGDGACLAFPPGIARTIIRFTENVLTEDHGDITGVLRRLEAAGMKQAMEAYPARSTTAQPHLQGGGWAGRPTPECRPRRALRVRARRRWRRLRLPRRPQTPCRPGRPPAHRAALCSGRRHRRRAHVLSPLLCCPRKPMTRLTLIQVDRDLGPASPDAVAVVDAYSHHGQVPTSGHAAHCNDGHPEHRKAATVLFDCPTGPAGMGLANRQGLQSRVQAGRSADRQIGRSADRQIGRSAVTISPDVKCVSGRVLLVG